MRQRFLRPVVSMESMIEDLNSCKGCGWLPKSEWDNPGSNDFEVEECTDYYLDVTDRSEEVRRKV